MVFDGAKLILFAAILCIVEVLNTGLALFSVSVSFTSSILNAFDNWSNISSASTSLFISIFLPWYFSKSAVKSLKSAPPF